jgi:hypothetical protein
VDGVEVVPAKLKSKLVLLCPDGKDRDHTFVKERRPHDGEKKSPHEEKSPEEISKPRRNEP